MLKTGILILFFISGFIGLLYEIVWTRVFGLIFGNTTLAISTVLVAFMLGLACGSIILGRIADRLEKHLRTYALLELGIGLAALLIIFLQGTIEHLFSFFYAHLENIPFLFHLLQFGVAFLVMVPATFLMGGTLPVLSHVVVREKEKLGFGVGQLYSINTLGAMAGCFMTSFVLVRTIGVTQTMLLAVISNVLIAIAADQFQRLSERSQAPSVKPRLAIVIPTDKKARIVFWAMAISGLAALSYEVLWSRVLVFVLTNSVYAFSVMLTTFLCGIGVGSYAGGRMADGVKSPLALLGWVECAIGVSAFIAAAILINLSGIHQSIFSIGPRTSWWYWNGIRFFEAFLVMFLPTCLLGASFPIAGRIVVPHLAQIGSSLGALYFFNTLGGVIGSFLTGFIFISLIGTSATMTAMVLINIFIGLYLLINQRSVVSRQVAYAFPIVVALLLFVGIQVTPKRLFTVAYSHVEKDYPLIDYREGVEGTVTVHEAISPFERTRRMDVDGLNVAGTSFMLKTLQTLQGHLPLFIHGDAEKVLQIGFGTGQTSHSALLHPIQEFELVEISEDVMELADLHFQELNKGVTKHPKFKYSISDGKNYVKYTGKKFDVIMNDANYAVATSSASLFTKDHFEYCKRKLKPGGILSTWMTIDLDPTDFEIVLKTFHSVFPYCALWMAPNCINKQVVLVGSVAPWKIDFQKCQQRLANPEIKNDLKAINISSVYDLLDCLVLDHKGIEDICKDASINSDDRPVLEFSTRAIRSRDLCAYLNLGKIMSRRPLPRTLITNLPEEVAERKKVEETLDRHFLASGVLLKGMLEAYQGRSATAMETLMQGSKMIPESRLAAYFFQKTDMITNELILDALKNPKDVTIQLNLVRHEIGLSQYDEALKVLRKILKNHPDNALVYYEMVRCYLGQAHWDSAYIYTQKSLKLNPQLSGAWYFLGKIAHQQGREEQALGSLEKALQLDPRMYEAYNAIGAIYKQQGSYQKAINSYEKSLSIMEYQPAIIVELADCCLQLKEIPRAIVLYRKALSMGSTHPKVFFNLGNAYYFTKDFPQACHFFQQAIAVDSLNAEAFYNLGNSYVMQKKFNEAIKAYEKAIALNVNEPDYFNNLALSYREAGRVPEAIKIFDRGLQLHPQSELLRKNAEETRKQINK